jgi:hypothetical protein
MPKCNDDCPGDESCQQNKVCMCGENMEGHLCSDHAPLSMHDYYSSESERNAATGISFQQRVHDWAVDTMPDQSLTRIERGRRFLEEAVEFVQALGVTPYDAGLIVATVYQKPVGDLTIEAGSAALTLAEACTTADINVVDVGETELARVSLIREKIRAKAQMMFVRDLVIMPAGRDKS